MLDSFKGFIKKLQKKDSEQSNSGGAAKQRLHMVLMQDRANMSADYIDLMKQDIIDDIKKYMDVDEKDIDVRLTNQIKNDGSNGAPALYANIPISGIKKDSKKADNITSIGDNLEKNKVEESLEKINKLNDINKNLTNNDISEEIKVVKKKALKGTEDSEDVVNSVKKVSAQKKTSTVKAKTTTKAAEKTTTKTATKRKTAAKVESKEDEIAEVKAAKAATKTTKTTKKASVKAE